MEHNTEMSSTSTAVDPICGMTVDVATAAASREFEGETYYFCAPECADQFDADPAQYAKH